MKPFWKVVFGGCLGSLIAFILVNLILFSLIGSLVSSLGSQAQQPVVPKNAILKIDVSSPVTERGGQSFDFSPLGGSLNMNEAMSVLNAMQALEVAAADPQIRFVYLKPDNMTIDIALAEELRAALVRFRESGKPVIAYCQGLTGGTCYLASVADKVILNPFGDCMITGMSSNLMYYKDLIDHLGIDIQLIRHGKYKSANPISKAR